jgi:hypothetical protein
MDPQYLRCPSPVSIPNEMCHPRTTLLVAYPVDRPSMIRVIPVTPAPTQNQMHGSLYTTASSSQSSSGQAPAQRPILPQDQLTALNSQNTSLLTNYGQLGLGLAGVQAQQQLDCGSGMGSLFLSPLPLPLPSHLPLNLHVPLPPGPSVSGAGASRSPGRTPLPLSLSEVGVSRLSRRSTPTPQPTGMDTATAFSSPHPYAGFLQLPETPTTWMPLISQSLSAAGRSGAGTPGGFDCSPRESAGGGTPAAATPAAATPAADAWRLGCARIRRDGVKRLEPVWDVPLKHVQEMREMTRKDYDKMYRSGGHGTGTGAGFGSGIRPGSASGLRSVDGVVGGSAGTVANSHGEGYLHRQTTTTTTGFSSLEHVTDGAPVFSDSEGDLLMQTAAYDVAGRNGLFPPLANSNWDEHANAHANADNNDTSGSGTMALPQLFFSGGGSSSAVDRELDILDDAASGGVQQHRTNDSSTSLSGSLDNDVNPPKADALPDNSSLSNAQAHLADDDDKDGDAPSSVVAAEFAGLSEQLSELDSWLETALVARGQSDVDDGSWFEQFFDESTVL